MPIMFAVFIMGSQERGLRCFGEKSLLESLVGQTLEIGWAFELHYNIRDAVNNFNRNPKRHVFGCVEVLPE